MSLSSNLPSINKIAEIMGGDVAGAEALVPGPGHSPEDRSLAIKVDEAAQDGFLVHSFADDDPRVCRDHVRKKLGLPEFEPSRKKRPNEGGRPFSTTVAKYVYRLADSRPYLQVQRTAAKQFFQYRWDGEKWLSGKPKGPKVPYMLPQLMAASSASPVYVVEGEKDADNLAKIEFVATCNSEGADNGSGGKWTPDLNQYFEDRHVYIIPDNDAQGRKHAQHVARQLDPIAASVRIVELPDLPPKGDVSDWLKSDKAGVKLSKIANAAPLWEPSADKTGGIESDEIILELAGLSKLAYAKRRKDAAEQIGIRVPELDKIVAEARRDDSGEEGAPALYKHWTVEVANEPVDGGILLRALKEVVQRYVFMSKDLAIAVALWIIFSWLHEFLTHSPLLYVTSAERDSGKSTLLGVLNFLARRALQSVDISGPALFRSIAKWQPTLIVDEADDALADNPDLRSVINSGWTRGQGVVRCHPDTHQPELFSTFAPKIVAMKGRKLPDTTLSRSIIITMKPRRAGDPKEHAADFDHLDNETFSRLRSQLMRFAGDNAEAIAKATPEIPPGFHNRRRANWTTLLAIGEACGGEWKTAAWAAALAIEAVADTFDPSIGVELLRAIKAAFAARATDRIKSVDLVDELVADATAPWATYNKGKQISERQVAGLLKPYGIKPRTIRLDDGTDKGTTAKGYLLEWFSDAFARYCASSTEEHPSSAKADDPSPPGGSPSPTKPDVGTPTEQHTTSSPERTDVKDPLSPQADNLSVTSVTPLNSHDFSQFSIRHKPNDVTDKKDEKTFENNNVTDVTDKKGGSGERAHTQPPYEVLGPAPAGERCWHCDKGGGVQRIKYGGEVNLWHQDCADESVAAMADPPVKVPELPPDPLDKHGPPLARHASPVPSDAQARPWPGLSSRAVDHLASELSEPKTRSATELEDLIRTRLAKYVPAAAIGREVEKVVRRIEALSDATVTQAGEVTQPASYEVLGPALPGEQCIVCGSGIGMKRIRHGGQVDILHPACAQSLLAAVADL
jgi:hypothetical protein